jgi:hypothetical protein
MDGMGCDDCRGWTLPLLRPDPLSDCAESFEEIDSHFSAQLVRCPRCETTWLTGYHEDLSTRWYDSRTGTGTLSDFGDRTWILRPLTAEHVAEIEAARGTRSLRIDTFAGSEIWFQKPEPVD